MSRAKGLGIPEILSWFNKNGHHTFVHSTVSKSHQKKKKMRIGDKREVPQAAGVRGDRVQIGVR